MTFDRGDVVAWQERWRKPPWVEATVVWSIPAWTHVHVYLPDGHFHAAYTQATRSLHARRRVRDDRLQLRFRLGRIPRKRARCRECESRGWEVSPNRSYSGYMRDNPPAPPAIQMYYVATGVR